MIKNVIIPEHINSYYIFSKRIVGIDISKTEIHAALIKVSGSKRKILDLIDEKIPNNTLPYEERVIASLKNIKTKLGKYDEIHAAFSSASVIFKELALPFVGRKKIKMVVPFEIESHLPFTIDQAIIDSIITKEYKDKHLASEQKKGEPRTEIMVAAVKREYIEQFIKLFEEAQLNVNKISVDVFELYALYLSIHSYHSSGALALIDLSLNTTKIAIIIDDQLKYIRVLPKGLMGVAKKIGSALSIDTNEAINQLFRFGINSPDEKYIEESKKAISELVQELQFTILSYLERGGAAPFKIEKLDKAIITGAGAEVPSINQIISSLMNTEADIFQAKKIMHNGQIESEVKTIPNSFLLSIATALPSALTNDFNLNQDYAQQKESKIIKQQIIATGTLMLLILSFFSIYSYLKIRNIKNAINNAEKEATTELKKYFKLREPITLAEANRRSALELSKQETAWKQLSLQNRYSILKALSELSKCINLKKSQLNITSISMKENTINLYGSVPGYAQLVQLQNQLKCPFFKPVQKIEDYNFNAEPIKLKIKEE